MWWTSWLNFKPNLPRLMQHSRHYQHALAEITIVLLVNSSCLRYCLVLTQLLLAQVCQRPSHQIMVLSLQFQAFNPIFNLQVNSNKLLKEIMELFTQIFSNWTITITLQEMVILLFGGLPKNLVNASTIMEMAWTLALEEINKVGEEQFGTGSTITIHF